MILSLLLCAVMATLLACAFENPIGFWKAWIISFFVLAVLIVQ